jgi:hypothetical protein
MCVKHNYKPLNKTKMDGKVQLHYPRKNWSSLILWNCGHPANRRLNLNMVNSESGKFLHRFGWLKNNLIGTINKDWNWLVGWYKEPRDGVPKALHFTEGGPWFKNYKNITVVEDNFKSGLYNSICQFANELKYKHTIRSINSEFEFVDRVGSQLYFDKKYHLLPEQIIKKLNT